MSGKQVPKAKEIELHPDAWKRFESAIGAIGKAGPIPHPQTQKKAASARKARKPSSRPKKS
jgi:hypothetical protein